MNFKDLLKKRRSVRDFEERNVPTERVKALIADCVKAPNAGNIQTWKFIVINNKEVMKRMSDASKASILSDIKKNPDSPMKKYEKPLRNESFNVFYNAPCLICIVGKVTTPSIVVDCAMAGCYLMFAAAYSGLATCWVALGAEVRDAHLLEEIGMPEGHQIHAPIIIGYPKKIPHMPERKKPNIIKIIT